MKKATPYLKIILSATAILVMAWLLYFEWLVPGYAGLHLPSVWRSQPLLSNRNVLQSRIGTPFSSSDAEDEWHVRSGGQDYILKVQYDSSGNAVKAEATYRYELLFFQRNYRLMEIVGPAK